MSTLLFAIKPYTDPEALREPTFRELPFYQHIGPDGVMRTDAAEAGTLYTSRQAADIVAAALWTCTLQWRGHVVSLRAERARKRDTAEGRAQGLRAYRLIDHGGLVVMARTERAT